MPVLLKLLRGAVERGARGDAAGLWWARVRWVHGQGEEGGVDEGPSPSPVSDFYAPELRYGSTGGRSPRPARVRMTRWNGGGCPAAHGRRERHLIWGISHGLALDVGGLQRNCNLMVAGIEQSEMLLLNFLIESLST
jgi:hypothetical protein